MSLYIYNTMSRKKELFEPINPERVTMYVCGPTVYNLAHIGNARPAIVFDTLYRLLQTHYDEVVYARNITDIDDKIIAAIQDRGETMADFTERYTKIYREDMAALNALAPTIEPQATDHIEKMIAMIEALIEKQHAYESEEHVLFAVQSMEDYGQLSNRSLDDMLAGTRVEVADYKRFAGDFVLWKPSVESEPGWPSPWGRGRPGWHLECSAMIHTHLGATIDIHGGGRDLIFPHHENEIAQGRCAHGGDYVRYWMHNGYVDIDGEKMAKSLSNFRMVRDLLGEYKGEVLRFSLLSAHYRKPLDFSHDLLKQAQGSLDSLYGALREVEELELDCDVNLTEEAFYKALNDDLNTPKAIAELHTLAKAINKAADKEKPAIKARLLAAGAILGILQQDPEEWFQSTTGGDDLDSETIEALIAERTEAKNNKDYSRADEVRERLAAQGVVLEDSPDSTKWRRE